MLAHEVGHMLGSPHTHDPTGYNPVIDRCGSTLNGNAIPPGTPKKKNHRLIIIRWWKSHELLSSH